MIANLLIIISKICVEETMKYYAAPGLQCPMSPALFPFPFRPKKEAKSISKILLPFSN